ncbi:MAG: TIGR02147 family protein [Fibrobacteres bacterium]|nr:TIGR02147 family protein [Fibrobacterota bacterium]
MHIGDMREAGSGKPIFWYMDYRLWLRDWLARARIARPLVVSSRWMAMQLNMDQTLVSKILVGERHLSHSRIQAMCDLVGLSGDEAEYFRQMVHYAKSKDHKEAQVCFQKMVALRGVCPSPLESHQSRYWERWETIALRELVACGNFRDEWERMGELLRPKVSAKRVRESMSLLAELGLAAKDPAGIWRQCEPFVRDGQSVDPSVLRHFHRQSLLLSADAIEAVPGPQRDISAVTVSVPLDGYPALVEAVREFRTKLLSLVSGMREPEIVCHVGIQVVPRSFPANPEEGR